MNFGTDFILRYDTEYLFLSCIINILAELDEAMDILKRKKYNIFHLKDLC
jgi:hypothetical protein